MREKVSGSSATHSLLSLHIQHHPEQRVELKTFFDEKHSQAHFKFPNLSSWWTSRICHLALILIFEAADDKSNHLPSCFYGCIDHIVTHFGISIAYTRSFSVN